MTPPINALFLTTRVRDWMSSSKSPRILHIFDRACNLINEDKEIVSIVPPEIGNGPFNVVIETDPWFGRQIKLSSSVSTTPYKLHIGSLTIQTETAILWDAHPNWKLLHANRNSIFARVPELRLAQHDVLTKYPQRINLQFSNSLSSSLATADLASSITAAKKLAGLGQGLTPSGDDYMMGAIYAAWIIQPEDIAKRLAEEIARAAVPLTTSLSAAWLRTAANGEAAILWRKLFDALLSGERSVIDLQVSSILSVGATSGADALAGFINTMIAYMEIEKKYVIS